MSYLKSMRLDQWVKNILVFIPLFAANEITYDKLLSISYIFISFSLVVSATYIYNDFKDIEADSNHPTKNKRPIAAGEISKARGYIFMIALFISGNLILFMIKNSLIIFSLGYTLLTFSYSEKLKYVKYFDILTISVLFVIRVLLGSSAVSVVTSIPLILFVFFTSLGIASGKKISILNNDSISTSRVKNFLNEAYSEEELLSALRSSFQLSLITYFVWIMFIKSLFLDSLSSLLLLCSCIFLFVFNNIFISKSLLGLTEEIIETARKDNNLLYSALLFGISAGLGVLI